MVISTARWNESTSNSPSGFWYLRRFSDARLHAESSRYMYSEQGFDALMRAVLAEVCQALTVVSNCRPGSPHCQAASAMLRHSSRALKGPTARPPITARVDQSRSFCTASMKSSETRAELFEFWKNTVLYAS